MTMRRTTVVVLVLRIPDARQGAYNKTDSGENEEVRRVIEAYCGQLAQPPQPPPRQQ